MLTDAEKYSLAFRTAIVSGVFSFVVCALLLIDYSSRIAEDPLNSLDFQSVKLQLSENSQDEDLKERIRGLDQQLRLDYFRHRHLANWGAWMLLGGVVLTLVSAKWSAAIRRRLPQPKPRTGPRDWDAYISGISRWAVAGLAAFVVLCTLLLFVGMRSILPSSEDQLAALLEQPPQPDVPNGAPSIPESRPESKVPPGTAADSQGAEDPDVPTEDGQPEPGEPQPVPDPADVAPSGPPSEEEVANAWPRFRGPGGLGISAYTNLPTAWDGETGEGILWKTEVPLEGNSSPIVWGKRIFVTGATEDERTVYCFDADTGKILWETKTPGTPESTAEPPEVGETTGFAACTPATDGRRVYAMFANGDAVGVDFDGNVVWSRSFGVPKNVYGHAASLAVHKDLVIVQIDQGGKDDDLSKLMALQAETGETVWETVRKVPNSWTTPIVILHDGQAQIVTAADPWVIAYGAADGKELWRAECLQADVGPSVTYADGFIFSANEFPGASAIRVPDASGTTEAEIVWEGDIGAPDCASPLVAGDLVLLLASYGTLTCYNAKEGVDPLWEEDFDDSSFTSSPTLVGERVYMFGEEGRAYVLEPTATECKRIAEASLGEGCVTSPACQDGRIYIRGKQHLFCIGSDEGTESDTTPASPDDAAMAAPTDEQAANAWPRFRGPGGLGVSAYANLPTAWDGETGEGILWKTEVPLEGNSSPIVWGKRIFVTGATEDERTVYCLDADTGKILWETKAPGTPESTAEPPEVGETTGFAACTPATDGRRVYAMFANGDAVGVDFDGNVVWSRSFGVPKNVYGHAASLAVHKDLVIVQIDQGGKDDDLSKLMAVRAETGKTVWETVRKVPNSWTTPIVIQRDGQAQIVTAADPCVIAYNAADGKELWRAECLQADVGPSVTYADGFIFSANEFPGATAIRVPEAADTTEAEIVWEGDIGAPDCASPLVAGDLVLLLASYGTLTCYNAKEGVDPLWEEDFDDSSFTSSPTLVGERVYMFGEEGRAYILEPTATECKRIAEASLGEGCVTSPACQDGRIYIRGKQHLFCIGD